jgi:peptidoglycan/LPS O-acetylase OafA/YrhL
MTGFTSVDTISIGQDDRDAASAHRPRALEGRSMVQLDGLRALAVLAVLWSHWAPTPWQFGLPWGTGVQLFFVLSGFLITGILVDHRPSDTASGVERMHVWRSFYIRRTLRIFPLFYLVLALSLILGLGNIRHVWMWHALYLSNFYYFTGHPLDAFQHFWSLAVEEQFYLVWPFLILLLPVRILPACIIPMIILAPLSRILLAQLGHSDLLIRLLPSSCLDALGTGALLAWTRRFGTRYGWSPGRVALLCLLIGLPTYVLAGAFGITGHTPYWIKSLGHTGMDLFYGWLVVEASVGFQGWIGRLLASMTLTYIGKISYGIYVFHFFAPYLIPGLSVENTAGGYALRIAVYTTSTLLIAAASWRFYERPLNRLKTLVPY